MMMVENVHTVSDWIRALATAITDRNEDALMALEQKARDWLQSEEEMSAQTELLGAVWSLMAEAGE